MNQEFDTTKTIGSFSYTTREQILTLIGVIAAWMFDAADYLLLTFLIKQIGEEFAFSATTKGWLMGLQLLGTGIGGIVFGLLGDSIGRKRTLTIVIAFYSTFTTLTAFTYSIAGLFIVRILTGIGVGGVWALGSSLISEIWPSERRNVGIALTQAGWPLGELLAALIVSFVVPPFDAANHVVFNRPFAGWRFAFIFGGLAIFTSIFIAIYVPESKMWLNKKEQKGERQATIEWKVFQKLFSPALIKTFALGLLFGITGMMTFYSINSWLPEYFQQHGKTLKDSALMIGLFWGTTGYVGHVLFGFLSNWFGRKPVFISYTGMIIASSIIMTVYVQYDWAKYLGLALFTFGCGYFSSFGAVFSEIYPTDVRSTAASISYNGARGFSLLAPVLVAWVGGLVGENLGPGILIGGFFVVLSSIILFFLPTKEKKEID
ncbi:MAG: MFS transporter [Candidatus Heimdallarchaeaceae archaeon]